MPNLSDPVSTSDQEALRQRYAPYLSGEKVPETAAELMAARYAAYALHDIDFILNTEHPERRGSTDRKGTERWSRESQWLGFEILGTEGGGPDDSEGVVEFVARYKLRGASITHRERATFKRHEGKWYFWEGELVAGPPVRRVDSARRNDLCPCGSGRKYKKCCGAS